MPEPVEEPWDVATSGFQPAPWRRRDRIAVPPLLEPSSWINFVVLSLTLFIAACAGMPPQHRTCNGNDPARAAVERQLVERYLAAGNLTLASSHIELWLSCAQFDPAAWEARAIIQERRGDDYGVRQAERYRDEAAKIRQQLQHPAPGTPVSQTDEEQKACQATNKLEPWEERAARTVKSAPGDAFAWFELGRSLTKQKCFADAEQAFRKSIGLWPEEGGAGAWNGLAELMLAQHRWNDMEQALREVVRLEPDSSWGWLNLSKALDRQRRFTDARQAYEHVMQWCSDGKLEEKTVGGGMVQPECTRYRDGEQTTVINNSLGTLTLRYTFTVESLFKQYPECQKLYYSRTTQGDPRNPIRDARSLADDLKLTVANGQLVSVTLPVAVDSMLVTTMQGRGLRLGTANLAFVSWMQQKLQAPATDVAPLCLITALARDAKLNAIEQLVDAFAKDVKNR